MSEIQGKDWSVFYAGHSLEGLAPGLSRVSPDTAVRRSHFIVINGNAIATIVDGLQVILSRRAGHPKGGPMHVDGAYSTIRKQNPTLVTYAYFPVLGYQRSSRSDIADLKWFDRVSVLAPIVRLARKLKTMSRSS